MMTLILFDIDGTLVFTENHQDSQSFANAYESIYQRPFPTINWHRYPHVTDTSIIETVIQDEFNRLPHPKEVEVFRNHYMDLLTEERRQNPQFFKEVPGARKMMERLLQRKGFCVGIATGGWAKPAEIKLGHVAIPPGQFPISGADGQATREDIIKVALNHAYQLHRHFDRIVYIGDALWDVQTTRNLKMNFVGIRRRNDLEVLRRAGAQTVLQNFLNQDQFLAAVLEAKPPC